MSDDRPQSDKDLTPLLIVAIYAVVSAIWIAATDYLVNALVQNHRWVTRIEVFKGWFFVLATSLLLYAMIRRQLLSLQQSEEQLREANRALLEISRELDVIFNSAPAMIYYRNRAGRLVRVNEAFARARGLTPDEVLGEQVDDRYPAGDAAGDREHDLRVLRSGEAEIGHIEALHTMQGCRWMQTDRIPFRDPAGRVIGVVGFAIDITERKMGEDALRQVDRAKNQFLDVLGHELKTPLTSILGWTQATEDNPEIIPQALEIIERNALLLRDMLDDLMTISRILHGKLILQRQPLELWSLVSKQVEKVRTAMDNRRLHLRVHAPETPLPVLGDPKRLRQVFSEMLDNAIKFSDADGRIDIAGTRQGDFAVIAVRDTGRGIPPEALATLFRPFEQIERTEQTGGLGLGLILIKSIIELHGGQVSAISDGPGEGTQFTVSIPLNEAAEMTTSDTIG